MFTFNSDLILHRQNLETSGDLAQDSGDFQESLTTIATGAKNHQQRQLHHHLQTSGKRAEVIRWSNESRA
jgi:hypothetical protein